MALGGLAGLLAPALAGWALCGATVAAGRAVTSLRNALIVHAAAAPVIFAAASWVYFSGHPATTPLQTATVYTALVIALDAGVVAPLLEKSYAMFTSVLGTWLPFALIFGATYLTGVSMKR